MFKYHLKKEHLNFMEGWSLLEKELIDDAPETILNDFV